MQTLAGITVGAPHRSSSVLERMKEKIYSGSMLFTDHCRVRMAERNAISFDLFKAIQSGTVVDSEWDRRHKNWKHRVEGQDMKGDELVVIAAIGEKEQPLYFLTAFD